MASLLGFGWAKSLARMILLAQPSISGAFNGQPHATLNAPMWTIAYEFRCYLLIAALGVFGILRRPVLLSMGIATLICSAAMSIDYNPPGILYDVFGTLQESVRFASMFLAGAVFYLYRDRADYRNIAAVIAAVFLAASLFNPRTAALAIPTLGAYLIFWFAFLPSTPNLNAINTSTDISYGVYLYGWPVQMLLVRFVPGIAPLSVVLLATLVSALLAYLSWQLIEKPCLSFKRGALVAALPR
jgi:peptidoglycan/LPS O-acetylase OafA/YrhL